MLRISQALSDYKKIEKILFSVLIFSIFTTSFLNICMSFDIILCREIGDFLSLFDSIWINHALISKIVLRLMQFVYTSDSVFFIILSCFSIMDYFVFFGSILFLLQLCSGGKLKIHQNWIRLLLVVRLVALIVLLVFLFFAVTSLTTAKGFFHLKAGAVVYLMLNLLCVVLACVYFFSSIANKTLK